MPSLSKAQLMSEPPGPRRTILALRRVGLNLKAIAFQNNCNPAVASRVLREQANTDLQKRIRDALVRPPVWMKAFFSPISWVRMRHSRPLKYKPYRS